MDFPLTNVALSPGLIPVSAKKTSVAWKSNGAKLIMRITILSSQALMEIVRDMEILLTRRLPLHDPTSPHRQATLARKANKTMISYPHTTTEEEVFHFTYFNDQVAQTAVGALRPYFIILLDDNVPANHAGNKRQRQSQGQEQGRPPPPPPSVSHMYDFALSDNPSQNRSYPATHGMTQHHTQMGVPGQPGNTYVYVPSPAIPAGYGTGREMIASSMPLAHTIPPTTAEHNHISPTTTTTQNQITPIAAEPINNPATQQSIGKAESPPATESLVNVQDPQYTPDGQSQFIETQQSVETSSGSSRAPNTSLPISNNQDSQVIETQQDKTRSSTVIEGDLLNIYDDDLPSSESGGLQINHPPLDPYEGTPWARSRYRDDEAVRPLTCQLEEDFYRKLKDQSSQVQGRPNQYIDAGVYSMTEDQLDGMIGEIVLEAGFQSFCERVFRVMDSRYIRDSREMNDFDEDF